MSLIWPIIKKTLIYLWDESFYLLIFNVVTVIAVAGGPVLLMTGLGGSIEALLAGAPLLLAAPPAIFGLFCLTYQIGEGKAVKFSAYFAGAKEMLKPAYVWGGINLAVGFLLATNIVFYRAREAAWGAYAAAFFAGLAVFWFILQLLALSLYPRLVKPGFKLAVKNATALLSMQPVTVVALLVITIGVVALATFIPLTAVLISLSFVALLANMTVAEILKQARQEGDSQ